MAELGINNVLPLAAGAGLEINGNVISISQTKPITVRKILFLPEANDVAIQINQDATGTSNAIFVVDKDDLNNLFINGVGNIALSDNTDPLLANSSVQIFKSSINVNNFDGATGSVIYVSALLANLMSISDGFGNTLASINTLKILANALQTILNNTNAPVITFDSVGGPAGAPNIGIAGSLDGTIFAFNGTE